MVPFHVIIPARFASTRLPAKMLADIAGKPLLQHTYDKAIQSGAMSVIIATDDDRIKQLAESFGAKVCMTSNNHESGTSRIAEAARILNYSGDEIIINVQGDEPLIPPVIIKQAAEAIHKHQDADVATLCVPIISTEELFNPNVTKVILDKNGYAIYFSRAPIPYERDNFLNNQNDLLKPLKSEHYRHVGIYAYRFKTLQKYVSWPTADLEITERLEQLRVLWNGGKIYVETALKDSPISVDSKEDLEKVRELINNE